MIKVKITLLQANFLLLKKNPARKAARGEKSSLKNYSIFPYIKYQ